MNDHELESVSGTVESVIFYNEDSGFTVLDLNTGDELLCVVGELGGVREGEELLVTGEYTSHATYGPQFKAEAYERKFPSTANAIRKYLASGVVKGIGTVMARRIVEAFGDETLEVIEHTPHKLSAVPGISQRKAQKIAEEFKEIFGIRTVMLYLNQYGIPASSSIKVWKQWGTASIDTIRDNPYVLCSNDFNISFAAADEIAQEFSFEKEDAKRIEAGIAYVLRYNTNNGHDNLPIDQLIGLSSQLLGVPAAEVDRVLEQAVASGHFYTEQFNKTYIYLPEYYQAEQYIASKLHTMIQKGHFTYDNMDFLISIVEEENNIQYEGLQREAIVKALSNNIFILTGGPGTGKTTTLHAIISLFEQQGLTVNIAAPTGRAAKRISEVSRREATTIHRLLEVDRMAGERQLFKRNEQNMLKADVVVIDEMSMVDTLLFESLLRALRPECKLILVGDVDQLPSVSAGNVLRDLIESHCIETVELKEIFRQAARSLIVQNAHRIVRGEMPELQVKDNDFFFLERNQYENAAELVVDLCVNRLPVSYGFAPIEDIQVLSPSRKGELGVLELNRRLQQRLNAENIQKNELKFGPYTFREGDKVMQIRNNYDIPWTKGDTKGEGIFNGDIGIIQMIDKANKTIAIDFDKRIAYYSAEMLKEIELAYAVTVHKSQGNEFDAVILPILGGYEKLYFRNLLYTAVTRAKKILIIVGSKERLEFMVRNNRKMLRYTCLKHILRRLCAKGAETA